MSPSNLFHRGSKLKFKDYHCVIASLSVCFFFTESGYITGGVTGSFKGEGLSRILLTYVREPYVLLGHLPVAPTPCVWW